MGDRLFSQVTGGEEMGSGCANGGLVGYQGKFPHQKGCPGRASKSPVCRCDTLGLGLPVALAVLG